MIIAVLLMSIQCAAAPPAGDRQKVIDFEDTVVEGMNRQALDSVTQLSERDRRKRRAHLYRKRASFKSESTRITEEMRLAQ